jgi:hypothetical protein
MDFSLNATWMILFWVIVILPLKIHNFYKIENKKTKDYLHIIIYSTFTILAGLCCIFSDLSFSISSIAFYILIGILYLQNLHDCFQMRTKWNLFFTCIFTVFIIILIVSAQ